MITCKPTWVLRCLALVGVAKLSKAYVNEADDRIAAGAPRSSPQRLAVVVPAYRGDLSRAVSSLRRWPTACSPVTLENVDLVLYYAEGEADAARAVAPAADAIAETAGRCFATTRTVYANLDEEEDIYPKGPTAMFYKMFLDADVRPQLAEYDALAVMEWDVLVASDRSFEELYYSAFRESEEEFWVKGSHLGGTDFHVSANNFDMWNVLGHINGNAIYNNNDPAFIEYVGYTSSRWELAYPFDVALWLTISDFPYSWPLYQRYSGKFVTTNLISNVGQEHVDHESVSEAIAGQTLFIHGGWVDEGNIASIKDTSTVSPYGFQAADKGTGLKRRRKLQKWRDNRKWERKKKWREQEKWRRDPGDEEEETETDSCLSGCRYTTKNGEKGRICDSSCSDGVPYGTLGCGAKQGLYNSNCRVCYNSISRARDADTPENRAIMCDTKQPPSAYDSRSLHVTSGDQETPQHVARRLLTYKAEFDAPTMDTTDSIVDADSEWSFFTEAADRPFTHDLVRSDLCVFIAGRADEVEQWKVTTMSILEFIPGMRVAVAVERDAMNAYRSSVGGYPGVTVSAIPEAFTASTASLYADQYCGHHTSLIFYIQHGSVVSRSFTSKDTHSPSGDLLVVYSASDEGDSEVALSTSALLGSNYPSFTYGTDMMLPVGANAELREYLRLLTSDLDDLGDLDDRALATLMMFGSFEDSSAVPQMIAALAYAKGTPGVWFLNPQEWASHHLFKAASIWEIPLVKPHYTCRVDPAKTDLNGEEIADIMQRSLDFYTQGGSCQYGLIDPA